MKSKTKCSRWEKLLKLCGAAMLSGILISTSIVPVHAQDYSAYSLPRLKKSKYTPIHDKKTDLNYIENEVTVLEKADYVNSWAITTGNKKISKKYKQGPGTGSKMIYFTDNQYAKKKAEVGMGLQNRASVTYYAFVAGKVYFH